MIKALITSVTLSFTVNGNLLFRLSRPLNLPLRVPPKDLHKAIHTCFSDSAFLNKNFSNAFLLLPKFYACAIAAGWCLGFALDTRIHVCSHVRWFLWPSIGGNGLFES